MNILFVGNRAFVSEATMGTTNLSMVGGKDYYRIFPKIQVVKRIQHLFYTPVILAKKVEIKILIGMPHVSPPDRDLSYNIGRRPVIFSVSLRTPGCPEWFVKRAPQ